MTFEVKPVSLDLTSETFEFELDLKDDNYNNKRFKLSPQELDELILRLKEVRILVHGLQAARSANAQAMDKEDKSEEAQAVRNILIDNLTGKTEEAKPEGATA